MSSLVLHQTIQSSKALFVVASCSQRGWFNGVLLFQYLLTSDSKTDIFRLLPNSLAMVARTNGKLSSPFAKVMCSDGCSNIAARCELLLGMIQSSLDQLSASHRLKRRACFSVEFILIPTPSYDNFYRRKLLLLHDSRLMSLLFLSYVLFYAFFRLYCISRAICCMFCQRTMLC